MRSLRGLAAVAATAAVTVLAFAGPAAAASATPAPAGDPSSVDTTLSVDVGTPPSGETSSPSDSPPQLLEAELAGGEAVRGAVAAAQWRARSVCRAPNGDGVIVVSNQSGSPASLRLVREADGHTVAADGSVGESRTSVPWGSPADRWRVVADGETVASVEIGNEWCVTTEVRVERLDYACDGVNPVLVGYDVVENHEGVELSAQPSRGGAAEIGTQIHFTLSEGSYSTSQAPASFTVLDGGTFHFGAVVRYDSPLPDCAAGGAPDAGDGPDVFATGNDPVTVELVDGVAVPTAGGAEEAPDPEHGSAVPGSSEGSAPVAVAVAGGTGGPAGDVLPATGLADVVLAVVGGVLLSVGLALLSLARRRKPARVYSEARPAPERGLRRGRSSTGAVHEERVGGVL